MQQLSVPLPPGPQFVIPGPPGAQLGAGKLLALSELPPAVPPPEAVMSPGLVVPPDTPGLPPAAVVMPPVLDAPLPPLPHPAAATVKIKMNSAVNFTKTEHTRFDMEPPVAIDRVAVYPNTSTPQG